MKKIIFFAALFCILTIGQTAYAVTDATSTAGDPRCFTKEQCQQVRMEKWGVSSTELYIGSDAQKACGAMSKDDSGQDVKVGFCSAAGMANTEIKFGTSSSFENLGEFIQIIYKYAVWAAGILAVVVIMIAGFQWLTSGGNTEAITSARKRIGNALMGLFLAVCSYLLLSQISPYLVNLRLPQVWMVQSEALPSTFKTGQYCDTTDSDGSKTECEKNKGYFCLPVGYSEGGPCMTVAKVVVVGSLAAQALPAAASAASAAASNITAASVGGALSTAGGQLLRLAVPAGVVWKGASAGKIAVNVVKVGGRLLRTGAIAGGIIVEEEIIGAGGKTINFTLDKLAGFLDTLWNGSHVGMCMPAAANLQKGEMCDPSYDAYAKNNGGCAKGLKCVEAAASPMIKCWAGGGFGFCSDGKNGATCRTDDDCDKDKNLACRTVVHFSGTNLDVKQCSDGSVGQPCEKLTDCGGSLVCYNKTCMPGELSELQIGNRCPFNESCEKQHCVRIDDTKCGQFRDVKRDENQTIFFRGVCASHFPITNIDEQIQTVKNLGIFPGLFPESCCAEWKDIPEACW